eukprot:tig00000553_g2081.t1
MAMQPTLWLGHNAGSLLVAIAAKAVGTNAKISAGPGPAQSEFRVPALRKADGSVSADAAAIAFGLLEGHADAASLIGGSPIETAEVQQWLPFGSTRLGDDAAQSASLEALNVQLLSRVYLVANRFTLADAAVYAALHPILAAVAEADRGKQYGNVWRWFDCVQNDPRVRNSGVAPPLLAFNSRTAYTAPKKAAAPAAAAAAPAAAAGADKKKAAPAAAAAAGDKKAAPAKDAAAPADKKQAGEKKEKSEKKEGAAPAEGAKGDKKEKGEKKEKPAKAPAAPAPAETDQSDISRVNLKVGRILKASNHPDADSLYVEEIDLGEGQPRTVVSGLRKFIPLEKMQDRLVVCVANLPAAKMRGIVSQAMVLAASNAEHTEVQLVEVPEGTKVGERVFFEGPEAQPWADPEEVLNPKKKVFDKVAPDLRTDAAGVAMYKSMPMRTSAGICKAPIPNGNVR